MSELKIRKRYTYKNHVYEIVSLGRMKLESNDWVDAVGYKRVLEDGDEEYEKADTITIYTRSRAMFEELFLPRTLDVGDRIMAISMGKTLREYEVIRIDDTNDSVYYRYTSGRLFGERCPLISSSLINFNGRIYITNHDDSVSHINCIEYYFISNLTRKILNRQNKIELIKNKLLTAYDAFNKIDVPTFRNDDILDGYSSEMTRFLEEIKKDGYIDIQWLQYKKQ